MRDYTKQEQAAVRNGWFAVWGALDFHASAAPLLNGALHHEKTVAKRPDKVAKALLCGAFVAGWDNPRRPMFEIANYSRGYVTIILMAADLAALSPHRMRADDLAAIRAAHAAHEAMVKGIANV